MVQFVSYLSDSTIVGKTEQRVAPTCNFESWLTSEHFLLHQLHGQSFQCLLLFRANRRILDRVSLMLWISYRNFSYLRAIRCDPVERTLTRFLSHSKGLDNMEAESLLPCSQLLNAIFTSQLK